MKAFDTDVLTEILAGNLSYAERIAKVPLEEQSAPIVAVEEVLRGRLNVIRQAEAGKARITIDRAYQLFEEMSWFSVIWKIAPFELAGQG